jgi:hypothetical protein
MKLSHRLRGTALWSGTANSTKLIRKIAAIQPVGWSAVLARFLCMLDEDFLKF